MIDNTYRTSVALPAGWHDRIRRLAAADRRSIHGQLIWLLGRGLELTETERREAAADAQRP